MAEYKNKKLGVRLVVPDQLNLGKQLEFYSLAAQAEGKELWLRLWHAADVLITEWECEKIPDRSKLDLGAEGSADVVRIIIWVGGTVQKHFASGASLA